MSRSHGTELTTSIANQNRAYSQKTAVGSMTTEPALPFADPKLRSDDERPSAAAARPGRVTSGAWLFLRASWPFFVTSGAAAAAPGGV